MYQIFARGGPKKEIFLGNAVPIKGRLKKGKSPLKRRSQFLHVEKNGLKYSDEIRRFLYRFAILNSTYPKRRKKTNVFFILRGVTCLLEDTVLK